MILLCKKLIFQLLILAVSIGYLITAINLGSPIVEGSIQPSFFPLILGSFAVLFSGVLFYNEFSAVKRSGLTETDSAGEKQFSVPIIIVSIFIYIIAFSTVGYFISSALFVFAIILVFSSKGKYAQKAAISIVIVTLGYIVFEQLFGVRLPALWG
ncbi:tripartite tricarboxylate transporter TctB family protein [Neptunomonas qingdaonensis]|uniref:Putative tricarboxylic transport membrane protein n=1 Tax=Neptunomonas qingdaonensis TaxID=1045558 RepID=A0A1I2SKB4_9GAMM|nr:tripartite tricarboxylate transporter TctB family protein [Neptunomonas qingdaonensis]SFG53335.1 putative tricarboxylic transport membrane protein [Neptunomonas qingdaonensis]